jgi:hypothetical protein
MPNEQYKEVELVYTVYRAAKIPKDAVVEFSHYGILYYSHQGKTYKTRTMEPGCDYKTHEKVCVNELDTDEEPDEEPDEVDENYEDTDDDSEDEDSDDEEEVLEDLTCAQLKQRLRAINKPVSGRKADLIQRIREHERLTAALFEED